ncbi:UNVERIFIED_CONTAM: hypothetical protein Sradi_1771400 [Sesamum radiatum]|uniref:Uncharacterized protein n=1 Tax=Sesamum radiatum TaxID=300843 RepID=A0AAW2TTR1_SESRA
MGVRWLRRSAWDGAALWAYYEAVSKARRHLGRAVWIIAGHWHIDWATDLRSGPTRARHIERPRHRRGPTMHRVNVGHETGVWARAGAVMPRRGEDAPCHRGCVGGFGDCGRDACGRLASRGRPLRDAKAAAESLGRTWAFRIGERTGTWCCAGRRSNVVLASFWCRRHATDSRYTLRCAKAGRRLEETETPHGRKIHSAATKESPPVRVGIRARFVAGLSPKENCAPLKCGLAQVLYVR